MLRELEYELEGEMELEGEFEGEFESELEAELEGDFEIIGRDTRVRVRNTMAAPFRYICHLEYNGTNMGTGTLIGPTTVLTAGHCLWDETQSPQRQYDPRLMRVIPGRNGGARPFGTAQAVGFRFSPGFRGSADYASPKDYGVIYLREPVGERVGYWTIAHTSSPRDPLGTSISGAPLPMRVSALPVNLSGYPDDKCRRRNNKLLGCEQWRAYNHAVREQGGILHYLNDTFGGHSGSPVWIKRVASLGGRVMVAIHISGDDASIKGKANRGVRITPAILSNIRGWLRAAPRPHVRRPPTLPTRPFRVLDNFAYDRPNVQPHHQPIIEEIARRVVAPTPPRVHTVRLVGHADSAGGDAYNLELGRRRAAEVQRALVAAIDRLRPGHSRAVQIVVQSLGEARPVTTNTTPQGRARNRRVEVFLAAR